MAKWQDIASAPKDGSYIILIGGQTDEDDYRCELGEEGKSRPVVGFWDHTYGGWFFAYWDGAWRCEYVNPTHWLPLPTPPETKA